MSTAAGTPTADAGAPAVTTTTVAPHELPDFDPMKAAIEADNATSLETPGTPPASTPKPAETAKPGEQGKPDGKDTKPDTKETAKPGEQGSDGKGESAFTKAQKEAERRDRSWKALEQEKAEFRQEKSRYDAELQGLRRELQQLKTAATAGPAKDEHGLTADKYDALEKKYRDEGDDEMAELARARADKLRRQKPVAEASQQPAVESWKTPEFQSEWKRNTDELIAEAPELNDPNNPVTKAANTLLKDKQWAPYFLARPDGIRAAVEVARLVEKSAQIDAIREKLTKAEAEVERLTKLTQPRGSHPSAPPNNNPKPAEELTAEDVMAAARAADSGG